MRGPRGNFNTAMQPQTSNTSGSPFLPGSGQTLPSAINTISNPGESQIYTHADLASQANPNLLFNLLPHPSGQGLSIPNKDSSNQRASAVNGQTMPGNQIPNLSADSLVLSQNGTGPLKRNVEAILKESPDATSVAKDHRMQRAGEMNVSSATNRESLSAWISKWPNVFRRADGTYVELRCGICGANARKNSEKHDGMPLIASFFKGPVSFAYHLRRRHRESYDRKFKNFAEWAVLRCIFRELSLGDLTAMRAKDPDQCCQQSNILIDWRDIWLIDARAVFDWS